MTTRRLDMARTKEILRLKWEKGLSHRQIARSLGVSLGVVGAMASRAKRVGLALPDLEKLDESELEKCLYGGTRGRSLGKPRAKLPDPRWVELELRRTGVTLELLHIEYLEEHPAGYRYTTYCNHYRIWKKRQSPSMRQTHRAGEKLFIDYSGKKPRVVDRETGEVREVELFVTALGASNKIYAEATESQRLDDWISSHCHALEFYGGVPKIVVPDQLRSAVTKPCRYEPLINRTYNDWARHYDCTVIPARPLKPKDKSKVEVAVQIAQRWILGRLRNETFFSIGALNERIAELLEDLNNRPMKKLGGISRNELFDKIEKEHLNPLPNQRFECGHWRPAKVNIDHHIEYKKHYYSVPYQLTGKRVELRISRSIVEIYHEGKRVASHRRGTALGAHSTNPEHMPKSHRKHMEWTPSRLVEWGEKMGPFVREMVESILRDRPHSEMGYRSCLGILRLEKAYGAERLNNACGKALAVKARSYQPVSAILKNGLDRLESDPEIPDLSLPPLHTNVRGADYYN